MESDRIIGIEERREEFSAHGLCMICSNRFDDVKGRFKMDEGVCNTCAAHALRLYVEKLEKKYH